VPVLHVHCSGIWDLASKGLVLPASLLAIMATADYCKGENSVAFFSCLLTKASLCCSYFFLLILSQQLIKKCAESLVLQLGQTPCLKIDKKFKNNSRIKHPVQSITDLNPMRIFYKSSLIWYLACSSSSWPN
jgi:hypothetical protein